MTDRYVIPNNTQTGYLGGLGPGEQWEAVITGDGIYFVNGGTVLKIRYNSTAAKWQFTNDGNTYEDILNPTMAKSLRIDQLSEPIDNTNCNVNTTHHGLCPRGNGELDHFLSGDIVWRPLSARVPLVVSGEDLKANTPGDTGNDATTTTHGYMSHVDKAKLNSIESGATADQTATEIESAYSSLVPAATQLEMTTGTEPGIRTVSPLRIAQAIAALAAGGGDMFKTEYGTATYGRVGDSLKLEGQSASFYRNAGNLNAGNVLRARLGALIRNASAYISNPLVQVDIVTVATSLVYTFPEQFDSKPYVFVSLESDNALETKVCNTRPATATNVLIQAFDVNGNGVTEDVLIIAIGTKA